jgi:Flp pilus assembly protein TadB
MIFDPPRTLVLWLINGIPAAVLTLIVLALIQPAVWAAAGLAGAVGVGAWTAELHRRSTHLPRPKAFIGS